MAVPSSPWWYLGEPIRSRVGLKEASVLSAREQETRDLRAENEQLRTSLNALRQAATTLRGQVGARNKHQATCEDCPCEECEVLCELEADAAFELDMRLVELDKPHEDGTARIKASGPAPN